MTLEELDKLNMGDELICVVPYHPVFYLGDRFYYIAHYDDESLYLSRHINTPTVPAAPYHKSMCKYLKKKDQMRQDKINQILK